MLKRKILLILVGLYTYILASCSVIDAINTKLQPPQYNVVLILTDDQRFDTLQYMPNVQEYLIEPGVVFTNAFATTPICCPSRASLFTGLYSQNNGVLRNTAPAGGFEVFNDQSTIATWLQDAGYDTALFGKYLNGYIAVDEDGYIPPGWDYWESLEGAGEGWGRYYGYYLYKQGSYFYGFDDPEDYSIDVVTNDVVEYISNRTSENPFFIYYAAAAPHAPADPAPRYDGYFNDLPLWRPDNFNIPDEGNPLLTAEEIAESDIFRIDQLESLLAVDDSVKLIVDALEQKDQLDNTLIIFTSDHGYFWGEHAFSQRKGTLYDEALRVPFVVRFPSDWDAPQEIDEFVLLIDIAPTIAEMAGIEPPDRVDGTSILPLVSGEEADWRNEFIAGQWTGPNLNLRRAIITEQWKYIELPGGNALLFDRLLDPSELNNLADDQEYANVVEELSQQLELLWSGEE